MDILGSIWKYLEVSKSLFPSRRPGDLNNLKHAKTLSEGIRYES